MKIKTVAKEYGEVMALARPARRRPGRPSFLMQTIARLAFSADLTKTGFTFERVNMERAGKGPWQS